MVGCGDVGIRVSRVLGKRVRRIALTSAPSRMADLRAQGLTPLVGNLDEMASLRRLAGLATRVIHLAPPPSEPGPQWWRDTRTLALARVLRLRSRPVSMVYASTSGVYGDCAGALVAESRPVAPSTPRAQRRVDAERLMRFFGRMHTRVSLLRIPGIYAPDRPGGTPRERLLRGTPVLAREDDVYTNHIHADDLARACVAALWRGRPQRAVNVNDDSRLLMGDYVDLAADLYGLPRPPRVSREAARNTLPLALQSFMGESRRLVNTRLLRELRLQLMYPHPSDGLIQKI